MVFWSFPLTVSFLRREMLFFSSLTSFGFVLKLEQGLISVNFHPCIPRAGRGNCGLGFKGGQTNHLFIFRSSEIPAIPIRCTEQKRPTRVDGSGSSRESASSVGRLGGRAGLRLCPDSRRGCLDMHEPRSKVIELRGTQPYCYAPPGPKRRWRDG
jgi:hypothetical protein